MGGYVGIPTSYTPVEYIESTSTQYIDTELKTSEVSKIQATASNTFGLTYSDIPYGNSLFGARVSATDSNFQYANGAYNEFIGNGTAQLSLTRNTSTNVLTIEISKTNYSVTSQNYNISGSLSVSISTPLNIHLFGLNNNGTFSGGTWKIYTFKMYDNSNNLIRDFIPVVDQDNVACLYDLVEEKFYYNQGSGSFTAGSATGQPVSVGSAARKIKNAYVGIPASYTPVEYIESSGTQYIDTGVVRDITKKFRFVASVKWSDIQTRQCIGAQGYVYFGVSGGKYQIAQGGTTTTNIDATTSSFADIDLTFNCPSSTCTGTVNNTSIGTISVTYQNTPENAHIHLFSLNDLVLPCSVQIASFQIYENDVLVRDFISVIDQDNVACMYELIEGRFYYNKGTGSFTAGSTTGQTVIIGKARKITKAYVGIPTSYTPVEYIESSGTQYIDTNVSTNSNTKIETEVQFNNSNLQECIWCGRDFNSGGTGINNDTLFKFQSGIFRVDYNGIGTNFSHTVNTTTKYKYVQDKNLLYENNTLIYTSSSATFATTNKLRLFAARNMDGSINNFFNGKVYSFKVYDNDTLVRDFIPVVNQDNVPCLYELVEGKYYYNKGAGSFTAGSTTGLPVSTGNKARLCYTAFDYGDGTNNNVSNGYVNKIYLNGVYTPSSGGTYFKGNYDLDPDPTNSQFTVIFNTIRVNADYNSIMNQSNHVSWLYGSNTIAVNIDATNEDKTCMINWRGNGRLASYCYYDNLKFSVGGTYMTLQQMVANKIIKPLVLISSSHNNSDNRMVYSNILNMYTGGQTDSKFYSNVTICFMLNKGYIIGNMQFYASASHDVTGVSTGDGLGWAWCPTSKANLTLNEY